MGKPITIDQEELDKLKAECDFYKKVLDNIPAAIHINNLETQLVEWINQSGLTISGYNREQIENNPNFLPNAIIADDIPWMMDSIELFKKLQNNSASYIYNMRHANGDKITFQGFGVVFDADESGRTIRNLALDIDITHEISNYVQLKRHLDEMTRKLHRSQLDNLTKTERQIVTLLCQGKSIKAIANEQNRSPFTIDNHKRNIFAKLGMNKTSQLVKWGNDVGLAI